MKENKVWLNGQLVLESKAKISVFDRGFLYGDGVYETVRVYNGKIFRANEHWKRLEKSLKGLQMKYPGSPQSLTKICQSVLLENGIHDCLLRLTLTRGIGHLGYDPSTCKKPSLLVFAAPIRNDLPQLWNRGVKIAFAEVRRNSPLSLNPALKTINCINSILAKIESLKRKAFEGIFLSLEGFVAEGTISNIFRIQDGAVETPPLECGILDGVTRNAVIEVAKNSGFQVLETNRTPEEFLNSDEIFLTSTTMEVMPVVKVNRLRIGNGKPGPITRTLQKNLKDFIRQELQLP